MLRLHSLIPQLSSGWKSSLWMFVVIAFSFSGVLISAHHRKFLICLQSSAKCSCMNGYCVTGCSLSSSQSSDITALIVFRFILKQVGWLL